jgi:hypothetical protein
MSKRRLMAAVLVLLPALNSCDEKLSDLTGPTPNLQPTFSSIQRDIFQSTDQAGRIACVNCHTGSAFVNGLNLTAGNAYASLVNVASPVKVGAIRVIPGDPENSYLIHKLEGRSTIAGQRMPRTNGPFLTEGQIAVIKRWIALGAPNN